MEYENPKLKHLRVYEDKSEYHSENSSVTTFDEGALSNEAKARIQEVKDSFKAGFLDGVIEQVSSGDQVVDLEKVSQQSQECIAGLVDSLTSEVGRALIGLSVMQMSIKVLQPSQNIRLHKGSSSRNSFSWSEGISMRTLDKKYVTPTLRAHGLLRLNADGFMMTRSLAENYPYTSLYKANLRGARVEWLTLVDELEANLTDPLESLKLLISKLINAANNFTEASDSLIALAREKRAFFSSKDNALAIVQKHIDVADYAARLLEISMHALLQSIIESGSLGNYELTHLSQMRSANKKHGNIGDIELVENGEIIESWDAKYGKGYLREEIEEASEKILHHESVELVGFVTTSEIERADEIADRISEIESFHSIELRIVTFFDWVSNQFQRAIETGIVSEEDLAVSWVEIYCDYLGQKRREQAPINEPCLQWVVSLTKVLEEL